MMRLDDMVVDASPPMVAGDFQSDHMPGVGIQRDFESHEFLFSRFFGNPAHLLNPDRGGSDENPAEMEVR